jgi:hypothetical protein
MANFFEQQELVHDQKAIDRQRGPAKGMFERYGIEWPVGTTDATIELGCYRHPHDTGLTKAEHMERAVRLLWPEPVYMFNYWTRRRIKAWCENDWITVWGASSTGKSTDFGMLAVAHWLSAPYATTMTICSTSKGALQKRIWAEVLKFYSYVREAPGRYYPSRTAIIFPSFFAGDGDEWREDNPAIKYSRNGIFGVAVQKGSAEQAKDDLIGVHNLYNAMILDEMQSVREAAVDAVSNLQGGKEFKFVGMGNPSSRLDLLGRESLPESGKWDDCNPDMLEWKTKRGVCLFFDGRKSPAITEENGEIRYPFLLRQRDIETRKSWYGENSRKFWSQTIGFIPADGAEKTVFGETFIIYNEMDKQALWDDGYELCGGVDWAFTEGGDRCILQTAKVGKVNGVVTLQFAERHLVPIDVSNTEPSSYLAARKVRDICKSCGIKPSLIGTDTSGTQGPQTDILEQEWEPGILRVGFGGKASERMVIAENKTAHESYANRVTELWYQMFHLGRAHQIKGVDSDLSLELCSRLIVKDTPLMVEPKPLMKARAGYSPDIADAAVIAVEVAVERLQLVVAGLNVDTTSIGDYHQMARRVNYNEDEAYAVNMEDAYAGRDN